MSQMTDDQNAAIASINDVLTEIVIGLAQGSPVSKGYAFTVAFALSRHTKKLGFRPVLSDRDIPDWENQL
jgi:hypothetical protein